MHRYRASSTITVAVIRCLWYGVFGPQQVQVIFVRDRATTGYDVALVTTDLAASPTQLVEPYAARWSIEVAIEDAKQITGVGQAATGYPQRSNAPSRSGWWSAASRSAGTPPPATTPPT